MSSSPIPRKPKQAFWPNVEDIESARAAAKQGVYAALFCAIVTMIFAALSAKGSAIATQAGVDAWAFLDGAAFLVIAWRIHKLSRAAAVIGLTLYIIERLMMMKTSGATTGIILMIFLIIAFTNAVRGTFAYHRLASASPPAGPPMPR